MSAFSLLIKVLWYNRFKDFLRDCVMLNKLLIEKNLPKLKAKEEMLDLLLREEYGYLPPKPNEISFDIIDSANNNFAGKAYSKKVIINCKLGNKDFSFPCYCAIPVKEGKHPFFVHINFSNEMPHKYQPTEELIDNGFAVLTVYHNDVTKDDKDLTNGLAGVLYPDGKRKNPTDAGKIAMWAWAAQRVLDFAETMPEKLDMSHACVCGHSRLGKTALLAGATDSRFKYVYSNNSGCSGAAITRGKDGEDVEYICRTFPYWFCENYFKYAKREDEMPFDQHYLIAAIAPRFVMVGSAAEDIWADPQMEMLACYAASDAFKEGFVCENRLPEIDDMYLDGNPAYHLRAGLHYFSRLDWQRFIEFVRKHY